MKGESAMSILDKLLNKSTSKLFEKSGDDDYYYETSSPTHEKLPHTTVQSYVEKDRGVKVHYSHIKNDGATFRLSHNMTPEEADKKYKELDKFMWRSSRRRHLDSINRHAKSLGYKEWDHVTHDEMIFNGSKRKPRTL